MRKIRLLGQTALVALVIATTGFTNVEAQPRRDTSVYSKWKKNQGYIHKKPQAGQAGRRYPKNGGYVHVPPGSLAQQQCRNSQAKARQAVNKVYAQHKQGRSNGLEGLERWYENEMRKVAEAEQRCAQVRSGKPITKESHPSR